MLTFNKRHYFFLTALTTSFQLFLFFTSNPTDLDGIPEFHSRILLNTNVSGNDGALARKLVMALCDVSLKELYSMQTQISSALHIAFSRYQVKSFPASYPTTHPSSSQRARKGMRPITVNQEAPRKRIVTKNIMVQHHRGDNSSTNDCTLPRRLDL